jgi:hypothetical protein
VAAIQQAYRCRIACLRVRPAAISPDGHDHGFSPAGDIFCPVCHSSGVVGG